MMLNMLFSFLFDLYHKMVSPRNGDTWGGPPPPPPPRGHATGEAQLAQ